MELSTLINIVYLLSAVTFMLGFKLMGRPETAQSGNLISGVGAAAAVVVTLMDLHIERYEYVLIGMVVGAAIGLRLGKKTPESKIPQITSLLNGFGGLASFLVAWAEFHAHPAGQGFTGGLVLWLAAVFGALTFSGSLLAWARLEEKLLSNKSITYSGQQVVSSAILLGILVSGLLFAVDTVAPEAYRSFAIFAVLALLLGIALVVHISHDEMPVMICLLNSYSGIAVCACGFILQNTLLIAAGALVGSSGIALTLNMCKDLDRPASYFFLGAFVVYPRQ
jgi:NAD(P) transhydrogenase subunit beta